MLVYLSRTALTANHQRLVNWLKMTLDIPVGFLRHNKDMGFELLKPETSFVLFYNQTILNVNTFLMHL